MPHSKPTANPQRTKSRLEVTCSLIEGLILLLPSDPYLKPLEYPTIYVKSITKKKKLINF